MRWSESGGSWPGDGAWSWGLSEEGTLVVMGGGHSVHRGVGQYGVHVV